MGSCSAEENEEMLRNSSRNLILDLKPNCFQITMSSTFEIFEYARNQKVPKIESDLL